MHVYTWHNRNQEFKWLTFDLFGNGITGFHWDTKIGWYFVSFANKKSDWMSIVELYTFGKLENCRQTFKHQTSNQETVIHFQSKSFACRLVSSPIRPSHVLCHVYRYTWMHVYLVTNLESILDCQQSHMEMNTRRSILMYDTKLSLRYCDWTTNELLKHQNPNIQCHPSNICHRLRYTWPQKTHWMVKSNVSCRSYGTIQACIYIHACMQTRCMNVSLTIQLLYMYRTGKCVER